MADLVDIASAVRDPDTNTIKVSAKSSPVGDTEDDAPGFDDAPLFGISGLAVMPWPADSSGAAQAIIEEGLGGQNGIATLTRDLRFAQVVEELGPGELALYAPGPDFDSRVFLKKQSASIMVGDDCVIVMDRENKRFSVSCFGLHFEMSEENGCVLTSGGATLQLKDAAAMLGGSSTVLGGRTPLLPLATLAIPQPLGVAPGTPILGFAQTPGVFLGV